MRARRAAASSRFDAATTLPLQLEDAQPEGLLRVPPRPRRRDRQDRAVQPEVARALLAHGSPGPGSRAFACPIGDTRRRGGAGRLIRGREGGGDGVTAGESARTSAVPMRRGSPCAGSPRRPTRATGASTARSLYLDISGFTRLSERLAARGRAGAEEVVGLVGHGDDGARRRAGAVGRRRLRVRRRRADRAVRGRGSAAARDPGRGRGPPLDRRPTGPSGRPSDRVTLRVSIGVATGPVDLVLAGDDGGDRRCSSSGRRRRRSC